MSQVRILFYQFKAIFLIFSSHSNILPFLKEKGGKVSRKVSGKYVSNHSFNNKITPSEAFDEFVSEMLSKGYSKHTINAYGDHVKEFVSFLEDKGKPTQPFYLNSLSRSLLIEWEGVLRLQRHNRDTSIQTKFKSIRTFLYWCMDEDRNYCPRFSIGLPKEQERLKEPYTEKEIAALIARPKTNNLSEWRTWAAVNLIFRTGLRRSSVCELRWDDIDYENKAILVRHSKNNKQQYVPMPDDAVDALKLWEELSPETTEGYVFFSTYTEGKLTPNALTQAIRKYNLKRGVKKTSAHLMRHTYATTYIRKGGQASKLQRILGHQTPDMTQRYIHFATSDLVDDVELFTI